MLIICENCGKKYRLDPAILGRKPIKFECKNCTHLILLPGVPKEGADPGDEMRRPLATPAFETSNEDGSSPPRASNDGNYTQVESIEDRRVDTAINDAITAVPDKTTPADSDAIRAMLSLRSKMLLLFFVLPVILFAISSVLFFYQMDRLEKSLTEESAALITRMAEEKITDLAELTRSITALRARSQSLARQAETTIAIILGGTLLIIGVIVSIFAYRLTARIRSLTDVADRISIGDLEVEIPVRSRDDFGKLAEAISRMQDSIRLSIERLRPG